MRDPSSRKPSGPGQPPPRGKTWCLCGHSRDGQFCDGSHLASAYAPPQVRTRMAAAQLGTGGCSGTQPRARSEDSGSED